MTYKPSKSPLLKLWNSLGHASIGQWLVSKIVCFMAPYFGSIKPIFTKVQPGLVELKFKRRRAVQNHIKTVHAIAMCNAAELAGGTCLDVSLHGDFRWIPIGMSVQYLKMAKTDLRVICKIETFDWEEDCEVVMPVDIFDDNNERVFHADITMKVSAKTPRHKK